MRNLHRAAMPLLALLAFAGTAVADNGKQVFEEVVEKTYPVPPNAKFRVKNVDGSVWIYGANISEMKMKAIKKAYTKDRLGQIDVSVVVRPDIVAIDTTFPPKPKWGLSDRSGTVDYYIILPWFCDVEKVELGAGEILIEGMRGTKVHAQLGSGRVYGRNCFTDLHLSVATGGLDVGYDWWETHRIALDAKISNGNIRVFIPANAQFRLRAESENGNVVTDFANNRPPGSRARLDLAIGEQPNASMNIKGVNGSVEIKETNR